MSRISAFSGRVCCPFFGQVLRSIVLVPPSTHQPFKGSMSAVLPLCSVGVRVPSIVVVVCFTWLPVDLDGLSSLYLSVACVTTALQSCPCARWEALGVGRALLFRGRCTSHVLRFPSSSGIWQSQSAQPQAADALCLVLGTSLELVWSPSRQATTPR